MYFRYIYYIILYTCRRISHCFLRAFHMVYTSTKCFFQTKARRAKGAEKMGRGIHVSWIRFAMVFLGDPKKIGGEKNTKKHVMKKTSFFLFTKNWNRDDVLFSICIAWKKSNLCFVLVCDWLCLDPFFWSGEVVRRPTKFAFYFSLWQLAAVVTWLTSCNSKWTIQKLYFMFGVKLKHFCSSSLGEV